MSKPCPLLKKYRHSGNPSFCRSATPARPNAPYNIKSWSKLTKTLGSDTMSLERLAEVVWDHGGPDGVPRNFVLYCADMGWLNLTPTKGSKL